LVDWALEALPRNLGDSELEAACGSRPATPKAMLACAVCVTINKSKSAG
jgi:hypothetical protein